MGSRDRGARLGDIAVRSDQRDRRASKTQTGPYASLYAPVLLHPAAHFYLGFGPSIFRDFGKAVGGPEVGAERTIVAASLEVGGYWGGAPPTEPASTGPRGPTRRFGDRGEFVIDGDVSASAFWEGYDGSPASSSSVSFSPGVDYFVVNHVSLGVGVSADYARTVGLDGASVVTKTSTSISVAPRVGVDIPLGRWFSFYPRARVNLGYSTSSQNSAQSANDNTQGYAGIGLYAPVLLHVAPHLFIGFGPDISHELTHSFDYVNAPSYQNRETTYGTGLVVGGWL